MINRCLLREHKKQFSIKATRINFATLFLVILITGFANNQQSILYQVDKYSIGESGETDVIIHDIVNPNDESAEPFKAMIYPNPSLMGKVKIFWMDNQNIDQIILVLDNI